ncbi:MAG: hypothetical protein WD894_07770 [Pirellulales bacterium]
MPKPSLSLQPSEAIVAQSAALIYAAYVTSGRVSEGSEQEWIDRSIDEAVQIARATDERIHSDNELG